MRQIIGFEHLIIGAGAIGMASAGKLLTQVDATVTNPEERTVQSGAIATFRAGISAERD